MQIFRFQVMTNIFFSRSNMFQTCYTPRRQKKKSSYNIILIGIFSISGEKYFSKHVVNKWYRTNIFEKMEQILEYVRNRCHNIYIYIYILAERFTLFGTPSSVKTCKIENRKSVTKSVYMTKTVRKAVKMTWKRYGVKTWWTDERTTTVNSYI